MSHLAIPPGGTLIKRGEPFPKRPPRRVIAGDVLAIRRRGFSPFAWAIWHESNGPYNHLANGVSAPGEDGQDRIVEALPGGVVERDAELYASDWWVLLRCYDLTSQDRASISAWNRGEVGKGYDWPGIFGFAKSRDTNDPNRWFCSELCRASFEEQGYTPIKRLPRGLTPPQDMVEWPGLVVVDYQWPEQLKEWLVG